MSVSINSLTKRPTLSSEIKNTSDANPEKPQLTKNNTITTKVIDSVAIIFTLALVSHAYYQNHEYVNQFAKETISTGYNALKVFGEASVNYAYETSTSIYYRLAGIPSNMGRNILPADNKSREERMDEEISKLKELAHNIEKEFAEFNQTYESYKAFKAYIAYKTHELFRTHGLRWGACSLRQLAGCRT